MAEKSIPQRVYDETRKRIGELFKRDDRTTKSMMAKLRHGVGKMPGEDPNTWGILFAELPEEMLGVYGEPSEAQWAIYIAMTLYAVHQQGKDPKTDPILADKVSLGTAANQLVAKEDGDEEAREQARERVEKRFFRIALASDVQSLERYLRGFIRILKDEGIGLDYPMLAKDLYLYQNPNAVQSVRLRWGQDFYRMNKDNESNNE